MAGEVPEAADVSFGDRRPGADRLQPGRKRRVPTAGVDDEIAEHVLAGVGVHADHMGDSAARRFAGDQTEDPDSSPHRYVVGSVDDVRDRGLRDGSPRGVGVVARIGFPESAGEQGVGVAKGVDPEGSALGQRSDDFGRVGFHHFAKARLEHVRQSELPDAGPLPVGPRKVGRRRRRRILLEDGDVVTVRASSSAPHKPTIPPPTKTMRLIRILPRRP